MQHVTPPPGAFPTDDGVHYRVWAPGKESVDAVVNHGQRTIKLRLVNEDGFFQGMDPDGRAGDLYKFRLDGDPGKTFPDPVSRYQPEGVHGPSMVIRPGAYHWQHEPPPRPAALDRLVLYELHVGTFTPEGTFSAAIDHLDNLVELGVNTIELMPLADFPGRWNWGYDGVFPYAPSRAYGHPDDLRAFVDAAHERGLFVVLDVVYNHLGPDGNYLGAYTQCYFNPAHKTPWGDALNFDGPHHGPVRKFFIGNIVYWMEEFRFDGFRLDAVHAILDESDTHILADLAAAVHARGGFVMAEDERNAAFLAEDAATGGSGLDALWADDFHHSVRVALTGEKEAYLANYTGTGRELADTLANGWHFRGQATPTENKKRGTPCAHLPPHAFCYCISNHDQVGNRAFGERLSFSAAPAAYRAASALLCLAPYTPLIFQGQEWAASTPFLYFTDHHDALGLLVTEGRRKEFAGFAAFANPALVKAIPDPQAKATFLDSKLKWEEIGVGVHAQTRALYREALRLRREEKAILARDDRANWQALALGENTVAIAYTDVAAGEMCMVVANLKGGDEHAAVIDEGPPVEVIFSTNEARFGGDGACAYDPVERSLFFEQPELLVLKSKGLTPS